MIITNFCVGCRQCWPLCPVGAIGLKGGSHKSEVDQARCVECGTCLRSDVCPVGAFEMPELAYPRSLRSTFSDVMSPHKSTGVLGRGTEEMKTNDVTGRLRAGRVNVSVELGRPGISAGFADIEIVTKALARFGVAFQSENPVTSLMTGADGALRPEVLSERVLSALVEFDLPVGRVPALVELLHSIENDVNTVFSVACAEPVLPGDETPDLLEVLDAHQIFHRSNGKTNVGLGRPFKEAA